MEETKKRTRKTAAVKEEKMAKKAPAAAKTAAEKKPAAKRTTAKKQEVLQIGELDQYLFGQGTHYDIYKKLGAHLTKRKGKEGVYFAVWAPHAKDVHVVGDFNGWNTGVTPMKRLEPLGIWEAFVPGRSGRLSLQILYSDGKRTRSFIRQILLPAPPSFVPEMPPRWRISANSAGQTIPG